jgi:hypothetical protein
MKKSISFLTALALLSLPTGNALATSVLLTPYFSTQTVQNGDNSFSFGAPLMETHLPLAANELAAQGELMFDLSSIPAGSTINNAGLQFDVASITSGTPGARIVPFVGVPGLDDWSPNPALLASTIPMNALYGPPSMLEETLETVTAGSEGNVFNTTYFIQQLASQTQSSAGFILTSTNGSFTFWGREGESWHQPTLYVEYTAAAPEPSTLVLLAIAAIGGLFAWRRRRQAA